MAERSVLPPVVRARFLFAGSIPRSAFFCFFCLWAARSLCVLRAGSGRVVCASVRSFPVFLAVGSIPGPVVFCFFAARPRPFGSPRASSVTEWLVRSSLALAECFSDGSSMGAAVYRVTFS